MSSPVVHFEIHAKDRDAAIEFYTKVFGWHVETMPEMDYGMVDTHGGRGFNGGITTVEGTPGDQTTRGQGDPFATVYIETADVQAKLDEVVAAGGTVVVPTTVIPDMVTFALFTDPHGNKVGIVQGDGGPQVSEGSGTPVTWFEIMGADASLQGFYSKLFGWEIGTSPMDGYGVVQWEKFGMGGAVGAIPNMPGYVAIYPEVTDTEATVKAIEANGGKILMAPQDMGAAGVRVGMFQDPQGITCGFYKTIPMA